MATLITKNSSTASAVPAAGDLVKGELAVNVTDKKVYTKDNSAAVVKLVGSLGNQEANAVAITGGTINGTTIGATTPSTGAFTTASASSGFTGNLTGNVTGNVSGTAANVTGVVAIANGGTGLSALGTGVQSALGQAVTGSGSFVLSTSPSLTTPNLGTPSAAVLTNATGLPLTTGVTGTLGVANGGTGITAFGTGVATALGQNVTGSGGIVLATSPSLTTPNLGTPSAATLTNATGLPISTGVSGLGTGVATALGVAVGSSGAFVVNGGALGTPSSGTLTNATGLPVSTGVSGLGTGVATALAVNTGSAGAFVVNGGALGTPSSGTVTNLTGTASININGTVGATTPTTGAFTTLSASGNITVSGGTANGVAYLNASKVLTTGSALTFDGTTFGVSGTAANVASFTSSGASTSLQLNNTNANAWGSNLAILTGGTPAGYFGTIGSLLGTTAQDLAVYATASNGFRVYTNGNNERLRITSAGDVGIGTSSPGYKLQVTGTSATVALNANNATASSTSTVLFRNVDGNSNTYNIASIDGASAGNGGYGNLVFSTAFNNTNTERMRIDASGNLGLGVTPSAWWSGMRALDVGAASALVGSTAQTDIFTNAFFNGSSTLYKTTGIASLFRAASGGGFQWFTAPSGTAGTAISFTQAMTLDSSGRLLVGGTTAANTILRADRSNSSVGDATVNSVGYFVNTYDNNTNGSTAYPVLSLERLGASGISNGSLFEIGLSRYSTASTDAYTQANFIVRDGNSSSRTTIATFSNNLISFSTGSTERARITSGGDFAVGFTSALYQGKIGAQGIGSSNAIFTSNTTATSGARYHMAFYENGVERGSITSNGSATAYNTSSDYRLKNITGPVTNSGAYIDSLKPVEGTWKADGSTFVGLIAHEAQEVSRTTVATGTKDGEEMQGMDYSNSEFIANIIAELQSLRARVAQLEAK